MLMPAFLLSVAMIGTIVPDTIALFGVLHLLVYPASNGYNSYFDRDTQPIGGLKVPPPIHRSLTWAVQGFDLAALAVTAWRFPQILPGMLAYQLASRLYSYHRIRLKALPWLSLVMVGTFQGVLVYGMVAAVSGEGIRIDYGQAGVLFCYLVASYPITQVYQIEEDMARGDRTVAAQLGIGGTLVYTACLFGLYILMAWWSGVPHFWVLVASSLPVLVIFGLVVLRYLRTGQVRYESVRLLTLLNGLTSIGYFGYCLTSGSLHLFF